MMNKLFKEIQKDYKNINIIFLCLSIYLICFPIISKILEKIFPSLLFCPYLEITGKQCPFCGGTRYFRNILNIFKDFKYIFNFFGYIFLMLIFEIIFRIYILMRKKNTEKFIIFDIVIHTIFLIYVVIYIINFIF